jgi:ParB family chromosome partitioning protein
MNAVQMIPIAKIRVINSRVRNKTKFQEIVGNISKLGLKKPITVSKRGDGSEAEYDLVCGQGRLEACALLGETEVPAVVVDVPSADRYIMSLVENLARRSPSTLDLAREIQTLKERGDSSAEIAAKVNFSESYVSHLFRLLQKGEERLVAAVEQGRIPLGIAVEISASSDEQVQRSLADAYESGQLRGKALTQARRLVELRAARGKGLRSSVRPKARPPSANDLVRTYKREAQRQELTVKKARLCEQRLRFVVSALKELFKDENLLTLLRAESLESLPKYLAESMKK